MRARTLLGMVVVLFLFLVMFSGSVSAVTVCDDGCDFTTLTDALYYVQNVSDRIDVMPGVLDLSANDAPADGYFLPQGLYITTINDTVYLDCDGIVLRGDSTHPGIVVSNTDGAQISQCTLRNFTTALSVSNVVTNLALEGLVIENNEVGISLENMNPTFLHVDAVQVGPNTLHNIENKIPNDISGLTITAASCNKSDVEATIIDYYDNSDYGQVFYNPSYRYYFGYPLGEAAKVESPGEQLNLEEEFDRVKQEFTSADLDLLSDGKITNSDDGDDYTYRQSISNGEQSIKHDEGGYYIDWAASGAGYTLTLDFPKSINLAHFYDEEATFFGKDFLVYGYAQENTSGFWKLIENSGFIDTTIAAGESATFELTNQNVTVEVIGVNTQTPVSRATIKVNGESKEVTAGNFYRIGGIRIYIVDIFAYTTPITSGAVRMRIYDDSHEYELKDGQELERDNSGLSGTLVEFTPAGPGKVSQIVITFESADSRDMQAKQYLGESLIDPLFGGFKIDFAAAHEDLMPSTFDVYYTALGAERGTNKEMCHNFAFTEMDAPPEGTYYYPTENFTFSFRTNSYAPSCRVFLVENSLSRHAYADLEQDVVMTDGGFSFTHSPFIQLSNESHTIYARLHCTAEDGEYLQKTLNYIIRYNYEPTNPHVAVTYDKGPFNDTNLTCTASGSTDQDGDNVTYPLFWYEKDSNPYGVPMFFYADAQEATLNESGMQHFEFILDNKTYQLIPEVEDEDSGSLEAWDGVEGYRVDITDGSFVALQGMRLYIIDIHVRTFEGDDDTSYIHLLVAKDEYDSALLPSDKTDVGNTYYCSAKAYDGKDYSGEVFSQNVTIRGPNQAPVLNSIGSKSVEEKSTLQFTVSATDPDGDQLTYTAINLPGGAGFTDRTFTWTPSTSQSGTYSVTFRVSDGESTDEETITITVDNYEEDDDDSGSSGSGSPGYYLCQERWQCSEWTACWNGKSTMTCTDINGCNKLPMVQEKSCGMPSAPTQTIAETEQPEVLYQQPPALQEPQKEQQQEDLKAVTGFAAFKAMEGWSPMTYIMMFLLISFMIIGLLHVNLSYTASLAHKKKVLAWARDLQRKGYTRNEIARALAEHKYKRTYISGILKLL